LYKSLSSFQPTRYCSILKRDGSAGRDSSLVQHIAENKKTVLPTRERGKEPCIVFHGYEDIYAITVLILVKIVKIAMGGGGSIGSIIFQVPVKKPSQITWNL